MLAYLFKAMLITSLIGTALTLALTLIKPITKKHFSGTWHYYMWLIVLAAMMLPFKFKIPEKVEPIPTQVIVSQVTEKQNLYNIHAPVQATGQEIESEPKRENITYNRLDELKSFAADKINTISLVWFWGMIILFVWKIAGYLVFLIKLCKYSDIVSCPELMRFTEKKIITRTSGRISSPLMTGLFKPTLLLPKTAMTPEQLDNVLAHEMTHFKRKDILYKWFISIVKCVHWFNPAVYYVNKQVNIECEISCDLAVVKDMSEEQEICYINTILTLLAAGNSRTAALTTGMTSDKKTLKRRFAMIKNKAKISRKAMVISIVLALVILCGTLLASGLLNGKYLNEYENELLAVNTDARENDNFNFLILGVDEQNRADTIMVLSVEEGNVTGISIPRDTAFTSKGIDRKVKLSEILNGENGDQKVIDTVKDTLSIPVTYFAKVKLSAIKEIVDSVGGIEFDVPMDMEYDDPYKALHIKLKQGRHTLNGDEVCGLLQFRRSNDGVGYTDGDMTRIKVGQQFITEFINQKLNKEFINKSPDIFKILADNIETNYPISNLINDIKLFDTMKSDIEFRTISGSFTTDNGIILYDADSGEIVSAKSEPRLVEDFQQKKNSQYEVVTDVVITQREINTDDVILEEISFDEDFENPVEGEISMSFGKRENPITEEIHEHNGIDIKAAEGANVVSSITGIVTDVGFDADKGNYIVVEKGNIKTIYSQLASTKVKKGDSITARQPIGTVGKTGKSTGAHLHFEVMVDGQYQDPAALVK